MQISLGNYSTFLYLEKLRNFEYQVVQYISLLSPIFARTFAMNNALQLPH